MRVLLVSSENPEGKMVEDCIGGMLLQRAVRDRTT